MARDLDIIIFGATGFTGKHTIPQIAKFSKSNGRNLSWGIAGRSEKKLKDVLAEYEEKIDTPLSSIPIIIADVQDEDSLRAMAKKARLIINCCGPYRFFGEPVVKACVEEGTHHVDVSGEPQYMESMQLKYQKKANEKGIYIISACGLDSIPTDLGVIFLQQQFSGTINSVTSYLAAWQEGDNAGGPAVNFGTWESAVYGLAYAKELGPLRRQLYPTRLPTFRPKLLQNKYPHRSQVVKGWVLPFLGSDRSVVNRTQRFLYENDSQRPVQVQTYFTVASFIHVVLFALVGLIFAILARFELGRSLLLKYPEIFSGGMFSREAPSEEKIEKTLFSVTFYAEGWKERLADSGDQYSSPVDTAITARVKGRNPGYGATCVSLVLAGITVLTETDKLPSTGGVFPPGYAFAKTSLVKELNENGVTFEILSEKPLVPDTKY